MEKHRMIWGLLAFAGLFGPIIGMAIGLIRYNRDKDKVIKEVKEDYRNAQKAGGIKSLYYKHEHKRVFAKTFGLPIVIGLLTGLALMMIAFHFL